MPEQNDHATRHALLMEYLRSWADGTELWRKEAITDLEYMNGRQVDELSARQLEAEKRPLVMTNEIRPQAELMAGEQRANAFDFLPVPRGREDQRLSAVCTAVMKAVFDFAKEPRTSNKVFDDGTATGLGVAHVGTNLDDAEDIAWGDLFIDRLNQFSFVFDPWATPPSFQDGRFMGHLWWMSEDLFKLEYPEAALPPRGDWVTHFGRAFGAVESVGTPLSLQHELMDAEKGHVRLAHVYYKEPQTVWFLIDELSGDVHEGGASKAEANQARVALAETQVEAVMGSLRVQAQIVEDGAIFAIVDGEGTPQANPQTGQPELYPSQEDAEAALSEQRVALAQEIRRAYVIQRRKVRVIKWAVFTAFGLVATGDLDSTSRAFPYAAMVQRQWGDDVRDIEGITRQVRGRQDQVNKRNNLIDLNLAHSSHSGWLNKKGDGADTSQLEQAGTRPGVVIEYHLIKPEQIVPPQLPVGHFTLLQAAIDGIPRATGINAELQGLTSNSTVSGRAITARQRGGQVTLLPRMEGYTDYKLDLAKIVLDEIQRSMSVAKIRRIVGLWELKTGASAESQSIFLHPVTGEPATDDEIFQLLTTFKTMAFDLTLKPAATDETVRQMQFQRELELSQLITSSGRPIGPKLFEEMMHTADVSEKFRAAALEDLQAEQQALAAQQQQAQLEQTLNDQRGRGSGATNV